MTLLHINCCISPNVEPRTAKLASAFMDEYSSTHKDANIEEYVLETSGLLPLNKERLLARDALIDAKKYDDAEFDAARLFASADRVVVSAPYWELSFPSMLKIYVENISVLGMTFGYAESGAPMGLCRAERMAYLTCSGGPIGDRDMGADYMRAMCGVFGIDRFDSIAAENQDVWGGDGKERLAAACERAKELARAF